MLLLTVTLQERNLHGSLGQGLRQVGTDPLLNAEEKMPRASPGERGQQMCLRLPALPCEGVRTRPSSAGDCWGRGSLGSISVVRGAECRALATVSLQLSPSVS